MDAGLIVGSIFAAAIVLFVVAVVLSNRAKTTKRISILEFQRGVKFVDGTFNEVLAPGAYRVRNARDKVEVLDMRPQPIVIEGFGFKDREQKSWSISLGMDLLVDEPYTAISALKNQVNDSVAIMRDAVRNAVVGLGRDVLSERPALLQRLEAELARQLKPVGMRVAKLEITELWSKTPEQREVGFVRN